jgi:hypothetical protein
MAAARNIVLRQSHPVERIVGVVDDVAVAIGVADAVAGRVVTVGIHLRERVGAAGHSIAAVVTVRGLVGFGVGQAFKLPTAS